MESPYESPASVEQAPPLGCSTCMPESLRKPLAWGMLLVVVGLLMTGIWLWAELLLTAFAPTPIFSLFFGWLAWFNRMAGCLLLMGCLVSIYVPSSYGVARYAIAGAAMQLFILSGKYGFLIKRLSSEAEILFLSGIPTVLLYTLFLFLLAKQLSNWPGEQHLRRALVVAGLCAALAFIVAFAANTGDTISKLIEPSLLTSLATQVLTGCACVYLAYELILVHGSMEDADRPAKTLSREVPC